MKNILLLLIIPFLSFGQGWEQIFGANTTGSGYYGTSAQQVQDGGYIVCGGTHFTQSVLFGMTPSDICIFKTDSNGEEQWSKTFGSEYWDFGKSIQQTTNGGYVIAGYINGFGMGGGNAYLLKVDENGEEQWSQIFDFGIAESVQQTTDGGYIITGYDSSDIYLVKTDENGEQQWSQTFGESFNDRAMFVQQTTDGGYVITGCTSVINSLGNATTDIYLAKINANGEQQWSQIFGGPGNDKAHCVQQTTDGGYIITGKTAIPFAGYKIYLIKTDENGDSTWTKTYGSTHDIWGRFVQQTNDGGYILIGSGGGINLIKTNENGDALWTKTFGKNLYYGNSVQQTNDEGYILTGTTNSTTNSFGNGSIDVFLIKTNENGDSLWTKTYGGINQDKGSSVQQTNDGGYIITGSTSSFGNESNNVYLIKTNSEGSITSTFNIPTPSSNRKLKKVVDILGRKTKSKINTPIIEIFNDGSVVKKVIIE